MSDHDLHCSSGRVSSMPGSSHSLPEGTMCDTHEDRPAVKRIQGETDSFGCEYVCMCQECVDQFRANQAEEFARPRYCQWCKCEKTGVTKYRDAEEGAGGPVYDVCSDCRQEDREYWAREAAEHGDDDGDWYDDSGDDIDDDEDIFNRPYVEGDDR